MAWDLLLPLRQELHRPLMNRHWVHGLAIGASRGIVVQPQAYPIVKRTQISTVAVPTQLETPRFGDFQHTGQNKNKKKVGKRVKNVKN